MPEITTSQFEAIQDVLKLTADVWHDVGSHFTCMEAEALAAFLTAFGGDGDALLESHAEDDDEGDQHEATYDENGANTGWKYRDETDAFTRNNHDKTGA